MSKEVSESHSVSITGKMLKPDMKNVFFQNLIKLHSLNFFDLDNISNH